MLIMALAGCAAQKGGNNTGKSTAEEVLYKQAIQALDDLQNMYEEQEKSGKKSGRRRKET